MNEMSCIKIVIFLALDACLLFYVVESKSKLQRKVKLTVLNLTSRLNVLSL